MPAHNHLYTPIYATLPRHPKTLKLASALGLSIPTTIGHLICLWTWALDQAPGGKVGDDPGVIAVAANFHGNSQDFSSALADAGFISKGKLHHWHHYGGKIETERKRHASEMRGWREQQRLSKQAKRDATSNSREPHATLTDGPRDPSVNSVDIDVDKDLDKEQDPSNIRKVKTSFQKETGVTSTEARKIDPDRTLIAGYITDFAVEFRDAAKGAASTSRAFNIFKKSGLTSDQFREQLLEARATTQQYTGSITNGAGGGKNKMPYFFSVLSHYCGVQPSSSEMAAQ